jgi:hypothetical protein
MAPTKSPDARPLLASASEPEDHDSATFAHLRANELGADPALDSRKGQIFAGRVLLVFSVLLLASTLLLELRIVGVLKNFTLLYTATPLGVGLLCLLAATQFREFTTRIPGPLRIVWLVGRCSLLTSSLSPLPSLFSS